MSQHFTSQDILALGLNIFGAFTTFWGQLALASTTGFILAPTRRTNSL